MKILTEADDKQRVPSDCVRVVITHPNAGLIMADVPVRTIHRELVVFELVPYRNPETGRLRGITPQMRGTDEGTNIVGSVLMVALQHGTEDTAVGAALWLHVYQSRDGGIDLEDPDDLNAMAGGVIMVRSRGPDAGGTWSVEFSHRRDFDPQGPQVWRSP